MDALRPTLYFGRPIVVFNGRFSPELAFSLMQAQGVTHTFLFPTALKAMMKAFPRPREQFRLALQGLMSASEAVGDAVFDYCQQQHGVTVNEMLGQTEINYMVGNCSMHAAAALPPAAAVPPEGGLSAERLPALGAVGSARVDADGHLWCDSRADDVFKAAGYRIGPGEIENCLVKHPAVANAAVVPKPDSERCAVLEASLVLAPDLIAASARAISGKAEFDKKLMAELQAHVKKLLAPYEYPKDIEFIDALPMSTTGKVQ